MGTKAQNGENGKVEGGGKRESLLLSLWRKMMVIEDEEEDEADESEAIFASIVPPAESKPELPIEKNAVPENLSRLYALWHQQRNIQCEKPSLVEEICTTQHPESRLLQKIIAQADIRASEFVEQYENLCRQNSELIEKYITKSMASALQDEKAAEGAIQSEVFASAEVLRAAETMPPLDGEMLLYTAEDWLSAWCMIFPPLGTGRPVTEAQLRERLRRKGIVFGLQDAYIKMLTETNNALRLMPVAFGTPAVQGKDAQIIERFSHDTGKPHFIENAQGIVDFENLNWLVPIEKGTVICDIIPQVKGHPGTDIRGCKIKPYNGKRPLLPMGENVVLNEEGTALQAKVSGQISYRNGKYHVVNTITIPGNVDLSTGSLNVRGDLIICGNVLAGFTVQASGDITVGGIVEGSQIMAGGSIVINHGMNGNLVGSLSAGKDIYCKYMENASVHADGDVHMDSIVNCKVSCNGRLLICSGRGAIIGGSAVAMGGIEAKIIGNKAGRLTTLSIGPTMQFLRESEQAERELETVEGELKKEKEIGQTEKVGLNQHILELRKRKIQQSLQELEAKKAMLVQGRIKADRLYPIAQISINSISMSVLEPHADCEIYLNAKKNVLAIGSR